MGIPTHDSTAAISASANEQILSDLNELSEYLNVNTHEFLSAPESIKNRSLQSLVDLFKYSLNSSGGSLLDGSFMASSDMDLPLFYDSENVDSEQIWAQLEMKNDLVMKYFEHALDNLELSEDGNSDDDQLDSDNDSLEEEISAGSQEELPFSDQHSDNEELPFSDQEAQVSSDAEESGQDISNADDLALDMESGEQHELDDGFFSMSGLEKFADGDILNDDAEMDDEDDEENFDEEQEEDAGNFMFNEFFDSPQDSNRSRYKKPKQVTFDSIVRDRHPGNQLRKGDDNPDESEPEEYEGKMMHLLSDDEGNEEGLSTRHERQMLKMKQSIAELENANLNSRTENWQLQGEVSVKKRPENSLLEEDLEFDVGAKPVPVITEQVTSSLEALIKQRICDDLFDDVERRYAPNELVKKERELVELDDAKPQQSLAQVYETEYQAQQPGHDSSAKQEQEVTKEHLECESLFKLLCSQLDELTSFNYVPSTVVADLVVKPREIASISTEEAVPVSMTEESLLAPHEIYAQKKTDLSMKTKDDLTSEDKDKLRRLRKSAKRKANKGKQAIKKVVEKMNPGLGNKHSKDKVLSDLLGSGTNVSVIGMDKKHSKARPETVVDATKLKL